jgi:hypothetical protein
MAGDADTLDRDDDELQPGTEEGDEQQGQQAEDGDQAADDGAADTEGGATDAAADAGDAGEGAAAANDGEADELVVTIGDEPAADADQGKAPDWVRELRKANREKERRIRELEAQLSTARPAQAAIVVGDKPTLAGCDFDEDKFAAELEGWHARKAAAEQHQRAQAQAAEQAQQQWLARLDAVGKAAATLKVADADDALATFEETFSVMQQGIILDAPDDPKTAALLRYALGKNPKGARQLAAITNPVKFTWALKELEAKVKTTPRKTAPPPDQRVRGAGAGAGIVAHGRLTQLHAEAQRTGDYTQYLAAKRAARKAA